jgi:hypothetical protein
MKIQTRLAPKGFKAHRTMPSNDSNGYRAGFKVGRPTGGSQKIVRAET